MGICWAEPFRNVAVVVVGKIYFGRSTPTIRLVISYHTFKKFGMTVYGLPMGQITGHTMETGIYSHGA